MNWKIAFLLSLAGVAVGLAEVFGLYGIPQLVVWAAVFVGYAIFLARNIDGDYFVHALLASLLAGLWAGTIHAVFINAYVAHNPALQSEYAVLPKGTHPRLMMIMMGPFYGAIRGVVAGLLAVAAGKFMKRKEPLPSQETKTQ